LRNSGDLRAQRAGTSDGWYRHRLVMALVWTLLIMVLCWLPRNLVRRVEGESSWFQIPNLDKLVHCGLFVVFSILWLRVRWFRRRFGWVALGGFVLAVVTELVQQLPVVGRDASVADALTDVIGVLIGIAISSRVEPLARFVEARLLRETPAPPLPAEPGTAATMVRP